MNAHQTNIIAKESNIVSQTTRTYVDSGLDVEETVTEYHSQDYRDYVVIITIRNDKHLKEIITDSYENNMLAYHVQTLTYTGFDGKAITEIHTPYVPVYDKAYAKYAYEIFVN